MPSIKPRIMLTVPPEVRDAFYEYAEQLGKPAAMVITELLTEMVPQVRELTKFQKAVNDGKVEMARKISRDLLVESVHAVATPQRELEMFGKEPARKRGKK